MQHQQPARTDATGVARPDRLWPLLIAGGLFLVVAVNLAFVYIAVTGADEVVPSYVTEER